MLQRFARRSLSLQSAKMRIPSIKFRKGGLPAEGQHPSVGSAGGKQQFASPTSAQSMAVEGAQLPSRFLRRPISEEEIEYINRGGPA